MEGQVAGQTRPHGSSSDGQPNLQAGSARLEVANRCSFRIFRAHGPARVALLAANRRCSLPTLPTEFGPRGARVAENPARRVPPVGDRFLARSSQQAIGNRFARS